MSNLPNSAQKKTVVTEKVIEQIRGFRNDFIESLLKDNIPDDLLERDFEIFYISRIKREYLKRDLMMLIKSPLDLVHYSKLLLAARLNGTVTRDEAMQHVKEELKRFVSKY